MGITVYQIKAGVKDFFDIALLGETRSGRDIGGVMKRDIADLHIVAERHIDIHGKLEAWGRWIVDRPKGWGVQPMFRQYRSGAWQWHAPEARPQGSPQDHLAIERAVTGLPDKHREALRWCYVWPYVPVGKVRQYLAVTRDDLARLIVDGRDMVKNALRAT